MYKGFIEENIPNSEAIGNKITNCLKTMYLACTDMENPDADWNHILIPFKFQRSV